MNRGLLPLCAAVILLGQGCFAPPSSVPLANITATPTVTPDGAVAFREGFGKLPGSAPSHLNGAQPSAVLTTDLPPIPSDVTVLREWDTTPDTNLLRNITTALGVPSGTFGAAPQTRALSLSWDDGAGYRWVYNAPIHVLSATRLLPPASPFTGEAAQVRAQILTTADDFLSAHGIQMAGWGLPTVHTSSSGAWRVTYAASRDEQTVAHANSTSLLAGTLEGIGDAVMQASLELPRSLDRSNYPALAQGEVLRRLRAGGINPLPPLPAGASIAFESFQFVLYRHEGTLAGKTRVFYIPALQAQGTLRQGGTHSPYTTLVPLVPDETFGQ